MNYLIAKMNQVMPRVFISILLAASAFWLASHLAALRPANPSPSPQISLHAQNRR